MYYHSYQVTNAPSGSGGDFITRISDWIKQNDGILIAVGIFGFLWRPQFFAYQKTKSWNDYVTFGNLAVIALGAYGFLTSGKLSFGTFTQ